MTTNSVVGGQRYTHKDQPFTSESSDERDGSLDINWVRTAFVLPDNDMTDPVDIVNRYWDTTSAKFTDGRWGCNIGVNTFPQFTPYADIPVPGRLSGRVRPGLLETSGNYGMGWFWGKAFDDTAQIIYMRFGVPKFNSFLDFFSRAFDHGSSVLARTGRWPSFLYTASKFISRFLAVRAVPLVAVPILIYQTADFFFFKQSARFYNLKPTMHLYWGAVNTLVNTMAINMGIYPKVMMKDPEAKRIGQVFEVDQSSLDMWHQIAPDLFTKENMVDAFALATRAQRIANWQISQEFNELENGAETNFRGYVLDNLTSDGRRPAPLTDEHGKISFWAYLDEFLKLGGNYYDSADKNKNPIEQDPRIAKVPESDAALYPEGAMTRFKRHIDAEFRNGSQFAIFRVTHTGTQTESFSNATVTSDLENKFNSTSSSFAHQRFTIGNGAMFGDIAEIATGAITDVVMGTLSGVTFGLPDAIKGLMGDGYIDIPKHWQSSSARLPRASYKMQLVTPYGNPISILMNLFLPFCMVGAGAWPRSTGKQSYTSPFIVQLFDPGRVQIPMGIITEFTVARGSGNVGWNKNKRPLSFELSFTVEDLSSIAHMPLISGFDGIGSLIDEESTFTNYLSAVAGQSIYSQIYPIARAKIRAARALMEGNKMLSPAYWGSAVHDTMTNGILMYTGIGPLIEGLSRNADTTFGPFREQ